MNQALALEQAFERALEAIPARVLLGGLAVGYSGGLDSTVLLHLAVRWSRQHALPLHALHVHHGLSPNANAWAAHCVASCQALGVHCQVLRVDVQENGGGIEQAARHARYRALFRACRELGVTALLSAHHLDDQAETVLLNLLRGAGVAGVGGMREQATRHEDAGITLLRPLLDMPRQALEMWAGSHGLTWVEDESNQSLHLRRNLVRHELLPAISARFPAAPSVLARSAGHFRQAQDLLEDLAQIDLQAVGRQANQALDVASLAELTTARQDNLLRFWLKLQGLLAPGSAQLENMRTQLLGAGRDRQPQCSLGQFILRRSRGLLSIAPMVCAPPAEECVLHWHGQERIAVPAWHGTLIISATSGQGLPTELLEAGLRLGPRQGGERLRLHAQRPSRSLKNLYQEHAIPAWQREFLPLLRGEQGLIYAAGLGMDCRYLQAGPAWQLRWESELSL